MCVRSVNWRQALCLLMAVACHPRDRADQDVMDILCRRYWLFKRLVWRVVKGNEGLSQLFIGLMRWYSYCYMRFMKGEGLTAKFFGTQPNCMISLWSEQVVHCHLAVHDTLMYTVCHSKRGDECWDQCLAGLCLLPENPNMQAFCMFLDFKDYLQ